MMWRDNEPDPIIRVLHACQFFREKFGETPNEIHVPPQFPAEVRKQLEERMDVIVDIRKSFPQEVWVGHNDVRAGSHHLEQLDASVRAL